jgi:hypothetical protein
MLSNHDVKMELKKIKKTALKKWISGFSTYFVFHQTPHNIYASDSPRNDDLL